VRAPWQSRSLLRTALATGLLAAAFLWPRTRITPWTAYAPGPPYTEVHLGTPGVQRTTTGNPGHHLSSSTTSSSWASQATVPTRFALARRKPGGSNPLTSTPVLAGQGAPNHHRRRSPRSRADRPARQPKGATKTEAAVSFAGHDDEDDEGPGRVSSTSAAGAGRGCGIACQRSAPTLLTFEVWGLEAA
jgi:hypothetical protein